jgi:hypothetical protein
MLILSRLGELADVVAAARGDEAPLPGLERRGLHRASNAAIAFGLFAAESACLFLLAIAGLGLVKLWRPARMSAVACSLLAIGLALMHTYCRFSWLIAARETVKVGPFLLDAAVILLSINVCGTMFLPSAVVAYSGEMEPPDRQTLESASQD